MAAKQQIREIPEKLMFFQPEFIQTTVEKSYMEEYYPIGFNPTNLNDTIRFHVRGTEHWIDFQKSYFDVDCLITGGRPATGGGGAATSWASVTDDTVTLTNNILHCLFDSIKILANDVVISNTENYPVVSYLINAFNYHKEYMESHGRLYLFEKDDCEKMDDPSSIPSKTRKAWGPKVRGVLKIRVPLFLIKSYLISFVNLDIIMNRTQNQDFLFIQQANDTFQLEIKSIILNLRKAKLTSDYVEGVEQMLSKMGETIDYSLRECRVFTKAYAGHGNEIIEDNLFHGVLPDRIFFGFVDSDAFQGDRSKNPFNFKNKNITEVGIYVNGQPHSLNPIGMNFAENTHYKMYYHMLEALQTADPTQGHTINITRDDFKNGFTIFCFDMSADQYGGLNHYSIYNTPANVQLRIKFRQTNNAENITLIIYYELGAKMMIDKTRRVQIISK